MSSSFCEKCIVWNDWFGSSFNVQYEEFAKRKMKSWATLIDIYWYQKGDWWFCVFIISGILFLALDIAIYNRYRQPGVYQVEDIYDGDCSGKRIRG